MEFLQNVEIPLVVRWGRFLELLLQQPHQVGGELRDFALFTFQQIPGDVPPNVIWVANDLRAEIVAFHNTIWPHFGRDIYYRFREYVVASLRILPEDLPVSLYGPWPPTGPQPQPPPPPGPVIAALAHENDDADVGVDAEGGDGGVVLDAAEGAVGGVVLDAAEGAVGGVVLDDEGGHCELCGGRFLSSPITHQRKCPATVRRRECPSCHARVMGNLQNLLQHLANCVGL